MLCDHVTTPIDDSSALCPDPGFDPLGAVDRLDRLDRLDPPDPRAGARRAGVRGRGAVSLATVVALVGLGVAACGGSGSRATSSAVSSSGEIRFGARGVERGAIVREIYVLSVKVPAEQRSKDEGTDIVEQVTAERDGVAEEVRATFRTGTITRRGSEENDVPGPVSGKSYAVARRASSIEVTMADGHEAPEAEAEYVRLAFRSLGLLRPLSAALRSSSWHVGESGDWLAAPLREEVAHKIVLEQAKLRLASTHREKAADYAVFRVEGRARLPRLTDAEFPVEGELEVAIADATVSRIELRGRFKGERPESGWSEVEYRYLGQR